MDSLSLAEDARDVLVETASGDMGDSVDVTVADDVEDLLHIDPGRGEGDFPERLVTEFRIYLVEVESRVGEYLADKAETVGMYSRGGDSHEHVAGLDLGSVDEFGLLDHSCGVARNVIFPVSVHSRHFGGLAANEGATGLAASLCDSGHDGLDLGRDVLADSHIVEEEQRFGTLCEDVVHAHCDSINSDGVMLVHCKCKFQFRSDTVGAAHEDRLLDVQCREVEHASERADVAHHPRAGCGGYVFLDTADDVVSGFEAYACFLIIYCHITIILEFSFFVGILDARVERRRIFAREAGEA